MKLTYDPRYNIAYVRLQEKPAQVETIRLSDEINVDMSPDGTVYGIELLNANEQLGKEDQGNLVVVNEEKGERLEIPLKTESSGHRTPAAFIPVENGPHEVQGPEGDSGGIGAH